jgi:hypothetical protein
MSTGDAIRIGQVWRMIDQPCPRGAYPPVWAEAQKLAISHSPGILLNGTIVSTVSGNLHPNNKILIRSEFVDQDLNRWVQVQTHEVLGWVMAGILWHRSDRIDANE